MSPKGGAPLHPDEERVREALRGAPAPAADPAFRARLREQFVSGAIPARAPRLALVPLLGRVARVALPIAAGLAVAWGAADRMNGAAAWQVLDAGGASGLTVDGVHVTGSSMSGALKPGARIRYDGAAPMALESRGQILMQLEPGTDLTLSSPPGRWWGRAATIALRSGEVRITTGQRFHGASLAVTTAQAHAHVTGTTLAVICFPEGTCVCVCEGTVGVGETGREPVMISAGHRRFVYKDGRPPLIDSILPREDVQLGRMRADRDSLLEGRPSGPAR
jgi:hypothetical protein